MGNKRRHGKNKVIEAVFVIAAVIFGAALAAYIAYEEPYSYSEIVTPIIVNAGQSTYAVADSVSGVQRKWVTGPAEEENDNRHYSIPLYFGYYYNYDDYYDYPDYHRYSGICREYYDDIYHPLYGKCRGFYTTDDNWRKVERCKTYCDTDFEAGFDKCDAYEEGTREYRQCLEYYDEKYSDYDARCRAECYWY